MENNCPKCEGEATMLGTSYLKWGKVKKWQHVKRCQICGYETAVK